MTDLLPPRNARTSSGATATSGTPPLRPLAVGAAVAGAVAATTVLLGCMALGLVGWFASDGGSHGETTDALRVGADGWLLAHGSHLRLATGGAHVALTVVPLGLTLLCAYVAHRLGAWAARTSAVEDAGAVALGTVVLAGLYAVVGLVTAVLAASAVAEPGLLRSFVGCFVVAAVGGGTGLLRGSRDVVDWRVRVPEGLRAVLAGGLGAALLLASVSSVVLALALVLDLGTAATVLSRLHADTSGGLLSTLLVAAVAPNAVGLTASYLLGPGFAVGTGTLVSPTAVTLGPVPAFPLLAALPDPGAQPAWLAALAALPVLLAAVAGVLVVRRYPVVGYQAGALRGGLSGVLGGVLATVLVGVSGGAVGPGRMADVGAALAPTLLAATVGLGLGGLVGGVAATWWGRRSVAGQVAG